MLQRIIAAVTQLTPPAEILLAGSSEGVGGVELRTVREDPPFTGPLAGIAAAMDEFEPSDTATVQLLAGDLPFVTGASLVRLCEASRAQQAVATPVDAQGYPQYLFAAWPEPLLRQRLAQLETATAANQPVRRLYEGVVLANVSIDERDYSDIDSPEDLERLLSEHRDREHPRSAPECD